MNLLPFLPCSDAATAASPTVELKNHEKSFIFRNLMEPYGTSPTSAEFPVGITMNHHSQGSWNAPL
jgi:hypothetical protein